MKKLILFVYAVILVLGFYNVASAVEVAIKWCDQNTSATYEIGDIIMAQENDTHWGGLDPRLYPDNCFLIVQITDLTMEEFQASQWNQPLFNITDPQNPVVLKKRQFQIDKNNKIPKNIINFINNNDGFIVADKATVNNWINNKEGQF